ncbi:MAG: hypothetical protein ACI9F9_001640 [Candidatus Paceibacteria bacterium]
MTQLRLWIVLLCSVTFLAGLGTGLYLTELDARDQRLTAEFGEFERAFTREFSLDEERQRLLVGLLDHYNRETQQIKDHYASRNLQEMEPDLRRVGLEYRAHLRDRLLPESQRPKFDHLMANYVKDL